MKYLLSLCLAGIILTSSLLFFSLPRSVSNPAPSVVMECLDKSLVQFAEPWRQEVARRFPDSAVVLAHGGNVVGDQWICSAESFGQYTTVQDVVRFEQKKYPRKTLIVLCCNPGHLRLGISGVYYFDDYVFSVPDRAVSSDLANAMRVLDSGYEPALSRWTDSPSVHGNIFEAICD